MSDLLKGNTGEWEMVIGLEIHAQVISNAKLSLDAQIIDVGGAQLECGLCGCGHARHVAGDK